MSDKRLADGRRLLAEGDEALGRGHAAEARKRFDEAIEALRGPEVRIGEAHALWGLAQIDLASGQSAAAERKARKSCEGYRVAQRMASEEGAEASLVRSASDGLGRALTLLADITARSGDMAGASALLDEATESLLDSEDGDAVAGALAARGRAALRAGDVDAAEEALVEALSAYDSLGDDAGQVAALLVLAEVRRSQLDLEQAAKVLDQAHPVAQASGNPALQGRVLTALGSVRLQQLDLEGAQLSYEAALPLIRRSRDIEREGTALVGLGEVRSRLGQAQAIEDLLAGLAIMARLRQPFTMSCGLLRLSEHALRIGEGHLALASAEGARRMSLRVSPIHGQGLALRMVVKSLASLKAGKAVLLSAMAREALVADAQPNAREVADYYRKRAPAAAVRELDQLSAVYKLDQTARVVASVLDQHLQPLGATASALGQPATAMPIIRALVAPLLSDEDPLWPNGLASNASALDDEPEAHPHNLIDELDDPPTDPSGGRASPEMIYVALGTPGSMPDRVMGPEHDNELSEAGVSYEELNDAPDDD